MSDLLLKVSSNPQARQVIKALGLPIPIPEVLERAAGPWAAEPLAGRRVWLAGGGGAAAGGMGAALRAAGAQVVDQALAEGTELHGLVADATAVAAPGDLRLLLDVVQPGARALRRCGRVVVVGRAPEGAATAAEAAARGGLSGFTRSLAKELGRRGATAQLVTVDAGAEAGLAGVLAFLLSPRSAYVTGQVLHVAGKIGAAPRWAGSLSGQVALVTGAGRGIGRETAAHLAAEGARVLVVERPADEALAVEVAREIGGRALGVELGAPGAADALGAAVAEEGGLDVLVHNAGITRDKTLGKMTPELWDAVLAVNLTALVEVTDRLLTDGRMRPGARLVALSSISGLAGNAGQTNYAASKSGVAAWVRHLAARHGDALRANAVAPGFIETRMTDAMPFALREVARRMNSLGQGGHPGDVAEAITFLALPASAGVSGQVLRVCGGALVGA